MNNQANIDALDEVCPVCEAVPGHPCRDVQSNRAIATPHHGRGRKAARRFRTGMAHANRSKQNRTAASNPTPAEVRAARAHAKHTPEQAAKTVYATVTMWQEWESDTSERRRMHPASFELYLLKTGQKTLEQVIDEEARRNLQAGQP